MESSPSGRVLKVLANAMMQPAMCATCGRPAHRAREVFADPQIYIEYHGNIYFCEGCALELAAVFGALSAGEILSIRNQRDELLTYTNEQSVRIHQLESTVDALSSKWLSRRADSDNSVPPSLTPVEENTEQSPERSEATITDGTGTSPVLTESGTESGPGDVSEFPTSDDAELKRLLATS